MLKVTIVTVTLNSAETVRDCLRSVESQDYPHIEHVIVDGSSIDNTLSIVREFDSVNTVISEPDKGLYDALNKGFKVATGDVVGILHSDDIYAYPSAITEIVGRFESEMPDYVYGDIQLVNSIGEVKRHWAPGLLKNGHIYNEQLPHPAIFLSKGLVMKLNPIFDISYRIAADLKQQLVFANKLQSRGAYLPKSVVNMRLGGASTGSLGSYINGWKESRRAWNEVHGAGGTAFVVRKVLSKIRQFR